MLETIGLVLAGICFGVFSYTFYVFVMRRARLSLGAFSYAYFALAMSFVVWGIACAFRDANLLAASVIAGEAFILLGTVCMLSLLPHKHRMIVAVLGGLAGIVLLNVRGKYFWPSPAMHNGILLFNTQRPVMIALVLLFVLVWLPISVQVARQVARFIGRDPIAFVYPWTYGVTVAANTVFLMARRPITVVLSFVAIGVCFAMLIMSNLLVRQLQVGNEKPR